MFKKGVERVTFVYEEDKIMEFLLQNKSEFEEYLLSAAVNVRDKIEEILLAISRYSPPLNNIPCSAAFPEPIINAAGVAIPSAQGHAIIITETKAKRL